MNSAVDDLFLLDFSFLDIPNGILRYLAAELGAEWQLLATNLDFKSAEIQRFLDGNNGPIVNVIFAMLSAWQKRQPHLQDVDIRKALIDALEKSERNDLAQNLATRFCQLQNAPGMFFQVFQVKCPLYFTNTGSSNVNKLQ